MDPRFPESRSSVNPDACPGLSAPLRAVLWQLAQLLESIDDEQYTAQPVSTYGGSIGGHVRHCLDHVQALLRGIPEGVIDYDDRQRGTAIESDAEAAIEAIGDLCTELDRLRPADADHVVDTKSLLAAGDPPVRCASSVGRELAFVLSHTIHHGAMIGGMIKAQGGTVPEHFGYAPSTIAHLQQTES